MPQQGHIIETAKYCDLTNPQAMTDNSHKKYTIIFRHMALNTSKLCIKQNIFSMIQFCLGANYCG